MTTVHRLMLGTMNGAKIQGVQAAAIDMQASLYLPDLADPSTWTCPVDSGVSDHPQGFPETIEGAQNRALAAYHQLIDQDGEPQEGEVVMGLGVESGFIDVAPATFTSYNFDVGALFDGHYYYLGISPGFEYPRRLVRNIFLHRQPFQDARQYITTETDIERNAGIVGELAGGLIDRPEMTQLCVRLALIRYLQRDAYEQWQ